MTPRKRKLTKLEVYRRSVHKHRRYIPGGSGLRDSPPQYFRTDKLGRVKRSRKSRGYVSETGAAKERHYSDFLTRSKQPPASSYKGGAGLGELGPELLFSADLHPVFKQYIGSTETGRKVLKAMMRAFNNMYRRIVSHIQREIVGDPRPKGGSPKGIVPRGGTGYMRLMTRSYLERQILQNINVHGFSYSLYFSIPVKYANPVNEMSQTSVRHANVTAWRITDYKARNGIMRGKYNKILLNDPNAEGNFYLGCVMYASDYISIQLQRVMRRMQQDLNPLLRTILDRHGNSLEIDEDTFIISPDHLL